MKRVNYQELEKYLLEETEDKEKQNLKFMTAALALIDNQTQLINSQGMQLSKVIDVVETYNNSILTLHKEVERLEKFFCALCLILAFLVLIKGV